MEQEKLKNIGKNYLNLVKDINYRFKNFREL